MALLWVESFEDDLSSGAYAQKGWTLVSGSSYSLPAGRWQGLCISGGSSTPVVFQTPNLGNAGTMIVGFSFRETAFTGSHSEVKIATFLNGTDEQISLWVVGTSGKIQFRVKRGATVIGTTTKSWESGYWIWVEFKAVFDTTGSNGSIEVRVNKISELLVENIDTTDHGSTVANVFEFQVANPSGGQAIALDDLFVLDGTGGSLNDFLGDRIVEGLNPSGDGNRNEWTRSSASGQHHDYVDEVIIDDDGTYLWVPNTSDGLVELFTFPTLSAIAGAIDAVFLYWDLRMDTNGQDKVRPIFRNGGGAEATGTEVTIDEDQSYIRFKEMFLQDPTIAGAWTVSNFNAMQMGLESRAV